MIPALINALNDYINTHMYRLTNCKTKDEIKEVLHKIIEEVI